MKILALVLLGGFTAVHLYHSYKDDTKRRRYTKAFLLPLIVLYYVYATNTVSPVMIAALVTSWIGDVLLMVPKMWGFVTGGISFLFSHILFICAYIPNVTFSAVNPLIVAPVALVYITAIVLLFRSLIPHSEGKKPLFIAMVFYILANGTMNIFALMQMLSNPCAGTIIAYIGAVFFFCSDSSLFLVDFHPKKDLVFKRHFTVMLTYVVGELLIAMGLAMIS